MGVMNTLLTYLYVYVVAIFYGVLLLLNFLWGFMKNPFVNPWQVKLRLEPPQPLKDPKYGVHKCVKVNDVIIHYLESGDPSKPLMIFVHGFPEFWYTWRHQIVEFNKNYWVVALDMRGYGDSEKPGGTDAYKLETLAKDIRELIRYLGRDKCIMVGHDWGSFVSCHLRDTYPECIAALVIVAGGCKAAWQRLIKDNPKQRKMSWYTFLFQLPYIPELMVTRYDMELFDLMLKKNEYTTDKDIECYKYTFGKPGATTAPINYYRANLTSNRPKPVREENVPFIHMIPRKDPYIVSDIADYMKQDYKYIETKILEGGGHFVQQEAPELFNKSVKDFLAKHNL